MKKILLLIPLLVLGLYLFTGQSVDKTSKRDIDPSQQEPLKWSDPLRTSIYDPSVPMPAELPMGDNYVHPNTEVRVVQTPTERLMINPSYRVLPRTNVHQSEIILEVNPVNPMIMFGSSNAVSFPLYISEGVYVTTNGGASWFGSDTLKASEPAYHGGDPAPTIDKNGNFIISHLGYQVSGMFGNYSTNNGLNWSNSFTIQSGSVDKNLSGTDDVPSSPYYGRSYTVWTTWGSGYPSRISYTTNGGVNWSAPTNILSPMSGYIARGEDVEVGPAIGGNPNGTVYAVWANNVGNTAEDWMAFAKSTDGGVTFTGNNQAVDMNGLLCFNNCFGAYGIRMNSFVRIAIDKSGGPRNGWIYVATSGRNIAPAGSDADIILHRSSDGGTTWMTPVRVNQDPLNNGKNQFYNAVAIDGNGGVNVIYYSNLNTSADSAECFVARSVDGGNTFTEIVASDHRFRPKPVPGLAGGYAGDYIGIAAGAGKIFPFWMDDITGVYQAWTAPIDLGPSVSHTPLPNTENITGPYVVNCTITPSGSPINLSLTKLHWRRGAAAWDSVLLTNTSGNNFTANIPGNNTAATYNYYIRTFDNLGRPGTSGSLLAPHVFFAGPDAVKPIITHTPLGDLPKPNFPPTIAANVVDPADYGGLDSVWVRWYKNTTANGIQHVKLTSTGGNNFSAALNQPNSYVNYNDSIFYRIIAQDNSTSHNRDSTALYKFKIVSTVTACIGTGTTGVAWPYNTFWHDSRTQMLYTAAEITAAGGAAGNIFQVGFDVLSAASQTMNGFNVRLQHTTATSITGWVTTGWTTVYTGTYTVPGTGLQYVTLQGSGFDYNGTGNLLMEICFDNTSYTSATNVASTAVTNMAREYHTDGSTGCSMTSGSSVSRPNTCFKINTIVGIPNVNIELPKVFSLAQNYPNPFNPTTTISYSIPKGNNVVLTVYDITGKEVAKLVNEFKQAGNYNVNFNASNLASGMYLYRIEAGDFVEVKKMVLVK
jgi:hypothetical protein